MWIVEKRSIGRASQDAYVQQWTSCGWLWLTCCYPSRFQHRELKIGVEKDQTGYQPVSGLAGGDFWHVYWNVLVSQRSLCTTMNSFFLLSESLLWPIKISRWVERIFIWSHVIKPSHQHKTIWISLALELTKLVFALSSFWKTYMHTVTSLSHRTRQRLLGTICYDPDKSLSLHLHSSVSS